MGYICPKNTFLQIKHYIKRIYPTLLSTTCVKRTKFLMSFLKPYVFFQDTNRLYYFNPNITYLWQKYPIKVQIFRFFTARVKIHQMYHVIFLQSLDHSSMSREINLLPFFSWNFICYWQKYHIKVQIFRLAPLALEFTKFFLSFLKSRASFSSNFPSISSVMRNNSSVVFI